MKIIFSPSKSQQVIEPQQITLSTQIAFKKHAAFLRNNIGSYSINELKKIFKCSDKKASEIQNFYNHTLAQSAIKAFTGTAFREINHNTYDKAQQTYLQQHLIILSAMYGVLRPFDQILPYRLDMTDKIFTDDRYKNLYEFWNNNIVDYFKSEECIINLASKEYSKMLKNIEQSKIINIDFLTVNNGVQKSVSVISKQQRGKMLNYMVKNNIFKISDIKKYSQDNFIFDADQSNANNLIFIQNQS